MKNLLRCKDALTLDDSTRRILALSSLQLIEKASLRMWDALRAEIARRSELNEKGERLRIVALCGKGDNGADALAVLRHAFSAGFLNLTAILSAREPGENTAKQAESLRAAGLPLVAWPEQGNGHGPETEAEAGILEGADILLDGILGTGLRGRASGEAESMIMRLNRAKELKPGMLLVSIDLPSGLGDGWMPEFPCVKADITLCLEPMKSACFLPRSRTLCGTIVPVADVFPALLARRPSGLSLLEDGDLPKLLPEKKPDDYKMKRGRLAIFAGSMGAMGAAQLCARAGLLSGAGYVTLCVDDALYPMIAPSLDAVIVKLWQVDDDIGSCDAILAGPGWGGGTERLPALKRLMESGIPLVLDAAALRLVAAHPELARPGQAPRVMTPHPGEFEALLAGLGCGSSTAMPFSEAIEKVCKGYSSILVLKSYVTWICSPDGQFAVWDGMCPELGTAGSGDVLAGLIAGLAARKLAQLKHGAEKPDQRSTLHEACKGGVIAHGCAGRNLARTKGWFEASDIAAEASRVLSADGAGQRTAVQRMEKTW